MSCQPTLLQSSFETSTPTHGVNIRGFGYSHLIKDNILSEKTNKFFCERKPKEQKGDGLYTNYNLVKSSSPESFNLSKSKQMNRKLSH